MLGAIFCRFDFTLNDQSFKLCIGMIELTLVLKRLIDTVDRWLMLDIMVD
jgi:hypothetical protein